MGKATKRQEMTEGRLCETGTYERVARERVACEKVVCVSKLCVRKCVWVAWRWWKRDCVRVRELYVKELCVKLLCGMCGQRQLRQDHRERSWQLLVLAAKNCCWQTAARTVMKTNGSSQVSAAGRRLPRSDGSTCTLKQVKTHEKKKVEFWSISLTILWPSNRWCTQTAMMACWIGPAVLSSSRGSKRADFHEISQLFKPDIKTPLDVNLDIKCSCGFSFKVFLRCLMKFPQHAMVQAFRESEDAPAGWSWGGNLFAVDFCFFFKLVSSIYPNAPKISMYDRLGQSLAGHHVSLGDVFSTDNVGWNKEFASLLMVVRRMPQRSIWLMLTNEVPESKIAGVLQNFFLDFGFGQGKATRLTGAWDIHAELFWRLFSSIPKFPLWHCYEWLMGNPILKSINVLIEFRAARPLYITPRLLFATCWPNTSAWPIGFSCPSCEEVHQKHSTMSAIQWLILHNFAHGFVNWMVDCDNESYDFHKKLIIW